jgi:hypothetical protein
MRAPKLKASVMEFARYAVSTTTYVKNSNNEYLELDSTGLANAGLTSPHELQRQTDFDMPWGINTPRLAETFCEEDQQVLYYQRPSKGWGMYHSAAGWLMGFTYKKPDITGKRIIGQAHTLALELTYQGWPARLDFEAETLHVNGVNLNRKDMMVLHMILRGMPRKVIANEFGVTIKAIEKRMAKLKDYLWHPDCTCYNLHGCLHYHGLTQFLLAHHDWFSQKGIHHYTKLSDRKRRVG